MRIAIKWKAVREAWEEGERRSDWKKRERDGPRRILYFPLRAQRIPAERRGTKWPKLRFPPGMFSVRSRYFFKFPSTKRPLWM